MLWTISTNEELLYGPSLWDPAAMSAAMQKLGISISFPAAEPSANFLLDRYIIEKMMESPVIPDFTSTEIPTNSV